MQVKVLSLEDKSDIFIYICPKHDFISVKILVLSPKASLSHDTAPFGSFDESLGVILNSVFWFVSFNPQR